MISKCLPRMFSFSFLVAFWLFACSLASAQSLVCDFPSRAFQTEYTVTNGVVYEDLNQDSLPDLAVFAFNGFSVLLGVGENSFGAPTRFDFEVSGDPVGFGDVDSDGDQDLVFARQGSNQYFFAVNDGAGYFELLPPIQISGFTITTGTSAALEDLNGDGTLDLVFSGSISPSGFIAVLFNDPDGGLVEAEPQFFPLPANTSAGSLVLGDFNADGIVDVLVSGRLASGAGRATVLINDGAGQFSFANSFPFNRSEFLTTADLNMDGIADVGSIVQPSFGFPSCVEVYLSDGKDSFNLREYGPFENSIQSISFGDVDADGFPELAIPLDGNQSSLIIMRNDGAGEFKEEVDVYSVGCRLRSVTFEDVNSDGHQDLLTSTAPAVSVVMNRGDGTYRTHEKIEGLVDSANWLLLADIFGTEDEELLVADGDSSSIGVFEIDAGGELSLIDSLTLLGVQPSRLAVGDIDADQDLDILVTDTTNDQFAVVRNDGSGSFNVDQTFQTGNIPLRIICEDLDGDLDLDVAILNRDDGTVTIRINDGSGNFDSFVDFEVGVSLAGLAAADFDGDGDVDIAISDLQGQKIVLLSHDSNANYELEVIASFDQVVFDLVADDFNNDGAVDLVGFTNSPFVDVVTFLNDGNGNLAETSRFPGGRGPTFVSTGDFNDDGYADILTIDNSRACSIYLNDGSGSVLNSRTHAIQSSGVNFVLMDLNQDNTDDWLIAQSASGCITKMISECPVLGDVNLDGGVNLLDVSPFVELVSSQGFQLEADINQDGAVNLFDVLPFVELLTD